MKTRHTRLFASVSAAALIGITALTPMATAQEAPSFDERLENIIEELDNLDTSNSAGVLEELFAELEQMQSNNTFLQGSLQDFLDFLSDYRDAQDQDGEVANDREQHVEDELGEDFEPVPGIWYGNGSGFYYKDLGDVGFGHIDVDGNPLDIGSKPVTEDTEQHVVLSLSDKWKPEVGSHFVNSDDDRYVLLDDGRYGYINENGDPLDKDGKPVTSPSEGGDNSESGNGEVTDEVIDNLFDDLNVTIEDGRIEVSFPVDLAGNPHTLTASLDAKNGFTVTLTPGGGSSNNGGGSSNNGGSDQDDDSTVISSPEVTPVYIDANDNTYPAQYDNDGNIIPPKNLEDGTYRLGFEIQGEDGESVIVGTDYNVKVGDGNMTEADNDEGGGVVGDDNETDSDKDKDKDEDTDKDKDKDTDKDGGSGSGSGNDSGTADFESTVSNLESLGAGGGGTDVGGGGTDSDGRAMQNAVNDDVSNSTSRNASPASFDNGTQTHASGQENLAVTGTNTNTLMAMVGGLLMAAAGVLLVGRRKGWV